MCMRGTDAEVVYQMKITEMSISRSRKYSINFQSYGYTVGLTAELCEGDDPKKAYQLLSGQMKILAEIEELKIKEDVQ